MSIYMELKKDHDVVLQLFDDLLMMDEKDENDERTYLIGKIRDELIPHARAEESVFYNSIRYLNSAKEHIKESYHEHVEAETLLRTLQLEDRTGLPWKKTADKLKTALMHHIADEEGKIFSLAKNLFTDDEANMMGEAFNRLKPEIREEGIAATTLELAANWMPPRLSKVMSKFNLESRL